MMGFEIDEKFERGEYIESCHIDELINYICGNLNSWTPNRSYWERPYNYTTKPIFAINRRKSKGLPARAKKGEMICYKTNELINFLRISHILIVPMVFRW